MKTLKKIHMLSVFSLSAGNAVAHKNDEASSGRKEYTTEGKNVKLIVTDLGKGKPLVLIHDGH
ncbi:hypothetical protein LZF95_05885 [Algoriphagus sp. AGSA1]|uniref:hypothetical protein n=1 Tax=Algoriphagus sp. AGSA1 TaxID=2907213 RepID=UPI001F21DC0F|nr:hypothetical protein [Algoriphagus sp. AGSA1]MCE7054197.1 hypothetical protein [Algoriphagus sp. AGSA1]